MYTIINNVTHQAQHLKISDFIIIYILQLFQPDFNYMVHCTIFFFRSIPVIGTENIPPMTGASGSVSQNLAQMAFSDPFDWTNVPGKRIYENGPVMVENVLYTQFGEVGLFL